MNKQTKKFIALALLGVVAVPFFVKNENEIETSISTSTSTDWHNILNPQYMRNDSCGSGAYGANRGSRTHKGIDLVCSEHQPIYAPFSGIITRHFKTYSSDNFYKGIEISDGDGTKIKIMYCYPDFSLIGEYVSKGQQIATCQAISNKYNCNMTNHLHIELWKNNVNINPSTYLRV